MTLSRFATRLNSFSSAPHLFWQGLVGKPTMMQMAERAASVEGLTDLDLNFPDHVQGGPQPTARRITDLGLSINGLAMRYYTTGQLAPSSGSSRGEPLILPTRHRCRAPSAAIMTICWGGDDYSFRSTGFGTGGSRALPPPADRVVAASNKPDEPLSAARSRRCNDAPRYCEACPQISA
jgi:xylose isomerase